MGSLAKVHERIRFEHLLRLASHHQSSLVTSTTLDTPFPISIADSELTGLTHMQHELSLWGWCFHLESGISVISVGKSDSRRAHVTACPSILNETVHPSNLLKHLAELQHSGSSSSIPSFIAHILKSKACRGSVMFGDTLSLPTQEKLLEALSTCANPCACAHGRTNVAKLGIC